MPWKRWSSLILLAFCLDSLCFCLHFSCIWVPMSVILTSHASIRKIFATQERNHHISEIYKWIHDFQNVLERGGAGLSNASIFIQKGSQKVSYSPANISKKKPFSIANSSVQINCPGVPNLSLRITWNRHYRPSHGLTLYLFKVARRSGLIRAIAFRLWPRINILAADFLPIF